MVKFGRSRNLLKRVQDHVTAGRHHGAEASVVLASMVVDEVRSEVDLLNSARERLEQVSQESFKATGLSSVGSCFLACGLEFMVMRVNRLPLTLVLDEMSFGHGLPDDIPSAVLEPSVTPMDKVKAKIVCHLSGFTEGSYVSDVRSSLGSTRVRDMEQALSELRGDGVIDMFYARSASGRELRAPQTRKYRLSMGDA